MSEVTGVTEPESELERLIAGLSESGCWSLSSSSAGGRRTCPARQKPIYRGTTDRRWWHVELGDEAAGALSRRPVSGQRSHRRPPPCRIGPSASGFPAPSQGRARC